MEREILVSIDLHGTPVPVGRLWWRTRKGRETMSPMRTVQMTLFQALVEAVDGAVA
jgi:hypothetical protein